MTTEQVPLPFPERIEDHAGAPPDTGVVLLPDWYADPVPTDTEMAALRNARDAALAAWQDAGHRFETRHPCPDPKTSPWRSTRDWYRARERARAGEAHRLSVARERTARALCLRSRTEKTLARVRAGATYAAPKLDPGLWDADEAQPA